MTHEFTNTASMRRVLWPYFRTWLPFINIIHLLQTTFFNLRGDTLKFTFFHIVSGPSPGY